MKILFIGTDTIDEYNSENWRINSPFRACRRAGIPCEQLHIEQWMDPLEDEFTKNADLVIFQRNVFGFALNKLLYWRSLGKPIVLDLDDAYDLMKEDTGSPSSSFWEHGVQMDEKGNRTQLNPKPIELLRWGAKIIGAVSSPSQVILDDWKKFGVRTYHLPNYLETDIYNRVEVYKEKGRIFIGGGGSMGHVKSWRDSGIREALAKICKEDDRLIVVFAGDGRVYGKLDVSTSHKAPLGWVPPALYNRSLSMFDFGLVPLAGEYDRRRSWIKPAEYAIMGIPWIGSKYEPNENVPSGQLVINGQEDWYDALKEMIEQLPDRQARAQANIPYVIEKYDIDKNFNKLLATYERIIEES